MATGISDRERRALLRSDRRVERERLSLTPPPPPPPSPPLAPSPPLIPSTAPPPQPMSPLVPHIVQPIEHQQQPQPINPSMLVETASKENSSGKKRKKNNKTSKKQQKKQQRKKRRVVSIEQYMKAIKKYEECASLNLPNQGFREIGKKYGIPPTSLHTAIMRHRQGLPIRSTKTANNKKITDELISLVRDEISRRTAEGSIPLAFYDGQHDYTSNSKGSLFCSVEFATVVEKLREYLLLQKHPEGLQGISNKARKPLSGSSYRKLARMVGVPKTVTVGSNTQNPHPL